MNPTGGGLMNFEIWDHLGAIMLELHRSRLIAIMKSRQVGLSWLLAAYALWFARFHFGANILLFSKGEDEAWELLAKSGRIMEYLPQWMQSKNTSNKNEIKFTELLSVIKAFPATSTAGVSHTGSLLVFDEWEWHPYATENFKQAKPTVDAAGAQLIGCFTVDKTKPDSLPKTIFKDALAGRNDFVPMFVPYMARPGRDEEWYAYTKRNTPELDLENLTREQYMLQNYPRTIEEALRPISTLAAVDLDVLEDMKVDCHAPIRIKSAGLDTSICHIYRDYHIGNTYIASTDTSHGVRKDYSVTIIMDARTGYIVADILNNIIKPDELAMHTVKMLEYYNKPIWWPEDNDQGATTIMKAVELGYTHFGYQDKGRTMRGWKTDSKTRNELWGALIPAFDNRQIVIPNYEGLMQFYYLIRNANKDGRIEAMQGKNDDYPIAVGICVAKMGSAKLVKKEYKSIQTLSFRS